MVLPFDSFLEEDFSEKNLKNYKSNGNWFGVIFHKFIVKISSKNLSKKLDLVKKSAEKVFVKPEEITLAQAEYLYTTIKLISDRIIRLEELHNELDFNDDELSKKIDETLKVLLKSLNVLHKKIHLDKPIVKTSDDLKKGVLKMNKNNMENILQ